MDGARWRGHSFCPLGRLFFVLGQRLFTLGTPLKAHGLPLGALGQSFGVLGLPFFDPAVEQRGAVAVAKIIEREVDARRQQTRIITLDHDPPRVADAELFKDFL